MADPADEVDRLLADPEISSLKSLNGGRRRRSWPATGVTTLLPRGTSLATMPVMWTCASSLRSTGISPTGWRPAR